VNKPTTLIVGCGYLGRRVGARLVGRDRVFGTCRSERRAAELSSLGIEPIIADVLDPATLATLPEVDRIFYCVGFDRAAGVPMREVYVEGLSNVLVSQQGRNSRFVYASATSVYGRNDGGWVDEDEPAEPITESGRVVRDAERMVIEAGGSDHILIRFSGLYGADRIVRRDALLRGEPIAGDPQKWLNLIHIDDAASAAIAVLDGGQAGRIYHATDDRPVSRREYYTLAAGLLDAPEPRFVPSDSSREEPNKRVSNARIKAELGFAPVYPDITMGLPAALDEERSRDQSAGAGSI
jgi:nucleoside-diphosphate-sugar epimerase